jgi:hypothetical protein
MVPRGCLCGRFQDTGRQQGGSTLGCPTCQPGRQIRRRGKVCEGRCVVSQAHVDVAAVKPGRKLGRVQLDGAVAVGRRRPPQR